MSENHVYLYAPASKLSAERFRRSLLDIGADLVKGGDGRDGRAAEALSSVTQALSEQRTASFNVWWGESSPALAVFASVG